MQLSRECTSRSWCSGGISTRLLIGTPSSSKFLIMHRRRAMYSPPESYRTLCISYIDVVEVDAAQRVADEQTLRSIVNQTVWVSVVHQAVVLVEGNPVQADHLLLQRLVDDLQIVVRIDLPDAKSWVEAGCRHDREVGIMQKDPPVHVWGVLQGGYLKSLRFVLLDYLVRLSRNHPHFRSEVARARNKISRVPRELQVVHDVSMTLKRQEGLTAFDIEDLYHSLGALVGACRSQKVTLLVEHEAVAS